MPHISTGGVSNRLVDEDFIAEPGTPVEKAIDEGLPDVGQPSQDEPDTEQEQGQPKEPSEDGAKDGDSWDPARKNEPDNQTPAFTPKKSTAPTKKK